MNNLKKYKISSFIETLLFTLVFICLFVFCFTDFKAFAYLSVILYLIYLINCYFSFQYLTLVYKEIDYDNNK